MSDTNEESPLDDTKTISLRKPIPFRGTTYEHLNLHEPNAGQMRKAEGQMRNNLSNEGLRLQNIHLIAMVSGWPVPVVEELPIRDFNEAATYLQSFIVAGPETGSS